MGATLCPYGGGMERGLRIIQTLLRPGTGVGFASRNDLGRPSDSPEPALAESTQATSDWLVYTESRMPRTQYGT